MNADPDLIEYQIIHPEPAPAVASTAHTRLHGMAWHAGIGRGRGGSRSALNVKLKSYCWGWDISDHLDRQNKN